MIMTRSEYFALIAASVLIAGCFFASRFSRSGWSPETIRAAVECRRGNAADGRLSAGLCYRLLERFSEDSGKDIEIILTDSVNPDSLLCGYFDIVASPYGGMKDSGTVSIPVYSDSIAVFSIREDDRELKRRLESWTESYVSSKDFSHDTEVFLRRYNPLLKASLGGHTSTLSPYDGIIREYADSIGWDWKLLAAVIYKESQFRIEARSHRGAEGLMQMMPSTARKWCDGDISSPEESVNAGARYLESLSRRYRKLSANELERMKFTLAAYNAGEGRIRDVINYAGLRKVDTGYWDSVTTVIPEMRDSVRMTATDTVRLGVFKGFETISYVKSVMAYYDAFNKIYIEQ